jgi:DNA invertase Pin-like site-specific DNA recombinase
MRRTRKDQAKRLWLARLLATKPTKIASGTLANNKTAGTALAIMSRGEVYRSAVASALGRLTPNILLSFAQFNREVTGERIRDKFVASRAKGMWMGGFVPMGYDVVARKLVINETAAAMVRGIFERFVELGTATILTRELVVGGARSKRGRPIDKGFLYKLLRNRV